MYSRSTERWLAQIARANNCSKEDVVRYCTNLSSANKVLSHLRLGPVSRGAKVLSHRK